jgi:hypothetical protein
MDMKKILQAFDGATTKKPVQGANDMKKFVSIVRESTNPYTPAQESVITSFEAGSVGGDANAFLLAADTIQDEVMAQVNKIKINADEANLRDMMEKFNAFMTAYHNVGKGILQPDMFNDSMGESVTEGAMDELHAELSDKFNELAPGIEKHKDKSGAEQLYNELASIAKSHGAESEFKRMCNGARNSAHMDYDTNPGGFENWFWYLPLGDKIDEVGMYRKPGSSTAYDRDYASSVSGMGKRDSIAYQQDGGANDEGWDEPRGQYQAPQDKPKMTGMFFYNVQPGQEQEAAALGIKKTKSGKWAKTKYNTSGRSFGMQKDSADKAFGVGKWWAPKNESLSFKDYVNLEEAKKGLE